MLRPHVLLAHEAAERGGAPEASQPRGRGDWLSLQAPPGEFIINFGEMLEMWTEGRVVATLHRVRGGTEEMCVTSLQTLMAMSGWDDRKRE